MFSDQREYFDSFKYNPSYRTGSQSTGGGLFFLPTVPPEKSKSKFETLFGLGGGVYGHRSVGGALQGDRTVDSALTLNCVERNDHGMPVMRSPSNEVASCRQLDAG